MVSSRNSWEFLLAASILWWCNICSSSVRWFVLFGFADTSCAMLCAVGGIHAVIAAIKHYHNSTDLLRRACLALFNLYKFGEIRHQAPCNPFILAYHLSNQLCQIPSASDKRDCLWCRQQIGFSCNKVAGEHLRLPILQIVTTNSDYWRPVPSNWLVSGCAGWNSCLAGSHERIDPLRRDTATTSTAVRTVRCIQQQ